MAAKKNAEEKKREYRTYQYETALCDLCDIQYQGDKPVSSVLEDYATRCELAAQQLRTIAAILRLRESDIRGAEGNVGAGGFCLPAEDFESFARLPWSPFDPGDHGACIDEGCENCEYDFRHGEYQDPDACPGDCSICPIAQTENPCLRLDSWRMTAGISRGKEKKHGGEYLCPDCWPDYESGAPSGVILVPAVPQDEVIVCKVCGALWTGKEA